jgi:hypothetical protein
MTGNRKSNCPNRKCKEQKTQSLLSSRNVWLGEVEKHTDAARANHGLQGGSPEKD